MRVPTILLGARPVALRRVILVTTIAGGLFAIASVARASSPVLSSAVDVREDASAYTVRLSGPAADDASVRLEGSTLHVATGSEGSARSDQQIALPEAAAGAGLALKREKDALVITVPKGDRTAAVIPPPAANRAADADPFVSMRSQFDAMRKQMAQMMNAASQDADPFGAMLGGISSALGGPAAKFKLEEKRDQFVLSAPMSEEDAKNVKISLDNDRVVKITSGSESKGGAGGFSSYVSSSSSQMMALPGPVKGDQMTMQYKDGRLEVVLPKA